MNIEITYEYDPKFPPGFYAKTNVNGEGLLAAGETWETAKNRLLDQVRKHLMRKSPPPPEIVTI
jgi:hypothetical protein